MSTGISKSPDSRYWRELYRAALYEVDKSKLPERIAEAERAVVLRAQELFQAAGDNGGETEAVDDVMYALHAFRKQLPTSGSVLICYLLGIKMLSQRRSSFYGLRRVGTTGMGFYAGKGGKPGHRFFGMDKS